VVVVEVVVVLQVDRLGLVGVEVAVILVQVALLLEQLTRVVEVGPHTVHITHPHHKQAAQE
jgi:hypothetical protein